MRHPKKRIILAFINKELRGKQRKKAKEHLSSCSECQTQQKLIMAERQLVKERIDLLTPEVTSHIPPFVFDEINAEICGETFFQRMILASVKVPAVILILAGAAFLAMSIFLFSKKVEPTISDKRYEIETEQLILVCQESMTSFPINIKLTGFRPIDNPKILVIGRDE